MKDGIIKGDGNSRYLKTVQDALARWPTWEDALREMIAGTFPFDLNGINPAGWKQIGTAMDKANTLTDATAALYGLSDSAVPNDVLKTIRPLISAAQGSADGKARIATGSYSGTGETTKTITCGFKPIFFACATDGNLSASDSMRQAVYSGQPVEYPYAIGSGSNRKFSVSGTGITIQGTHANYATYMALNNGNTNYYWVAIG